METPEIGDKVRINIEPECPGEFKAHGIRPYVQNKTGTITRTDSSLDHPWLVQFDTGWHAFEGRGYFKASELELI